MFELLVRLVNTYRSSEKNLIPKGYIYEVNFIKNKGIYSTKQLRFMPSHLKGESMRSLKLTDEGFTGLEAAIVLIAFVVVAAVFSYVVLGAGFFTTQKAQETVHTSVQQASSTVEIIGNIYGSASSAGQDINTIQFTLGLAPGGTPVDFDKVTMTFSSKNNLETLDAAGGSIPQTAATGKWAITVAHHQVTEDNSLQIGEQFDITATPTVPIPKDTQFSLEIKPSVGAAFTITRTTPPSIEKLNILY